MSELFTFEGFKKSDLCHHGIKGQKWGYRRYQNKDGSLTPEGRIRYYGKDGKTLTKKGIKDVRKAMRDYESRDLFDSAVGEKFLKEIIRNTSISDIEKHLSTADNESFKKIISNIKRKEEAEKQIREQELERAQKFKEAGHYDIPKEEFKNIIKNKTPDVKITDDSYGSYHGEKAEVFRKVSYDNHEKVIKIRAAIDDDCSTKYNAETFSEMSKNPKKYFDLGIKSILEEADNERSWLNDWLYNEDNGYDKNDPDSKQNITKKFVETAEDIVIDPVSYSSSAAYDDYKTYEISFYSKMLGGHFISKSIDINKKKSSRESSLNG